MKPKTVLILENDLALLGTLADGLRKRGFRTIAAGSAEEAWRLLADVPDLDVALLDILLGEGPIATGLDFGLELKKQRIEWPPEFLILSAHETPNYYQTAFKLGAAAYLTKGMLEQSAGTGDPPKRADIIARHVRALALRRALLSERPGMSLRLRAVAEKSNSRDEAIERFCAGVLSEELTATLGSDFILILTTSGKTVAFSGRALPSSSAHAFAQLQNAVHARLGQTEPFIVNTDEALSASSVEREATQRVMRPLDGAAFIALGEAKSFRLSLGLVPGEHGGLETVREQVKLVEHYLQKRVVGHLVEILELWSIHESARRLEAKRRDVLLTATSYFCLYQGQEMQAALWEAERNSRSVEGLVPLDQLRTIAAELRDAGEILTHFAHSSESRHRHEWPSVDMRQVVERIWNDEVSPSLRLAEQGVLRVDGRCIASDQVERAERAVAQILGWMGRRIIRARHSEGLALNVACHPVKDSNRVQVVFEERVSHRLPSDIRKSVFLPFYTSFEPSPIADSLKKKVGDEKAVDGGRRLGLYLAQTLVEMAGGELSDQSDNLGGLKGHRFVLELPAASHVA